VQNGFKMIIKDTKRGGWYWLGNPHEGDVWSPAFCFEDGMLNHDGDVFTEENIGGALIERAVMPHEVAPIKDLAFRMQSCDAEIAKAVNENFWNLI
jgi:hypothetical protein